MLTLTGPIDAAAETASTPRFDADFAPVDGLTRRDLLSSALADLGGQVFPLPISPVRDGFYQLGMESLREMAGADAILLWAPSESIKTAFLESPLWPLLPAVQAGHAVFSTHNVGQGSVYTVTECLRLWDQVYSTLA